MCGFLVERKLCCGRSCCGKRGKSEKSGAFTAQNAGVPFLRLQQRVPTLGSVFKVKVGTLKKQIAIMSRFRSDFECDSEAVKYPHGQFAFNFDTGCT